MSPTQFQLDPLYPDVLGAITGGKRVSMDKLQCALGIFPKMTYINQPVEVIVLLQNMVDQPMQIKVGIQTPTLDRKNQPVVIGVDKKTLVLGLRAGEVGALRIPIVPLPPTMAGSGFPVRVAVRYRTPNEGQPVRPPTGGPPPSVLAISSARLHVLREVPFISHTWLDSAEIMTTYFDIAPKRLPPLDQEPEARYESLWTMEEIEEERVLAEAKYEMAQAVANSLTRTVIYHALLDTVAERFGEKGMPLHPGEVKAIAKMMTYAVDEGLDLEAGFSMESSRWFHTLCHVLAANPELEHSDRGDLIARYLFEAALYDSILLGFAVIDPKVKEDLGDWGERLNFANRVLTWFAGQAEPDLSYIYLPLAMGGVVVNLLVTPRDENPWVMIDELNEALRGRKALVSSEEILTVFKLMDGLLNYGEEELRRSRVSRP